VNDNFGHWRSDAGKLLAHCLRTGSPAVLLLVDVVNPMANIATNSCILCTVHDAKMREFKVTVVSDCCAARSAREHNEAIETIREMAGARVVTLSSLRLRTNKGGHGRAR
jgi:isochorismate hydrolase